MFGTSCRSLGGLGKFRVASRHVALRRGLAVSKRRRVRAARSRDAGPCCHAVRHRVGSCRAAKPGYNCGGFLFNLLFLERRRGELLEEESNAAKHNLIAFEQKQAPSGIARPRGPAFHVKAFASAANDH